MHLEGKSEQNLVTLPRARQRLGPAAGFYSILVEILHALRGILDAQKPPLSIMTGVPLKKKAVAETLGLSVQQFNRKIAQGELIDGRHFVQFEDDTFLLAEDIVSLLFEDHRKAMESAPKPSKINPAPRNSGTNLNYRRVSR
jgi:hypothetical protein